MSESEPSITYHWHRNGEPTPGYTFHYTPSLEDADKVFTIETTTTTPPRPYLHPWRARAAQAVTWLLEAAADSIDAASDRIGRWWYPIFYRATERKPLNPIPQEDQ